jgi:predicted membrane metal-binding protein
MEGKTALSLSLFLPLVVMFDVFFVVSFGLHFGGFVLDLDLVLYAQNYLSRLTFPLSIASMPINQRSRACWSVFITHQVMSS